MALSFRYSSWAITSAFCYTSTISGVLFVKDDEGSIRVRDLKTLKCRTEQGLKILKLSSGIKGETLFPHHDEMCTSHTQVHISMIVRSTFYNWWWCEERTYLGYKNICGPATHWPDCSNAGEDFRFGFFFSPKSLHENMRQSAISWTVIAMLELFDSAHS